MRADEIAAKLCARRTGDRRWIARCPAHRDHSPSLSISKGFDGRTLLKCHAGCHIKAVTAAAGLSLADLFEKQSYRDEGLLRGRSWNASAIRLALTVEAQRYRERNEIDGVSQLVSSIAFASQSPDDTG